MARLKQKKVNEILLQAFSCGATVESAARKADVTERTVYRHRADPRFQADLREMKAEMVQRASAMLTAGGLASVKTLVEMQQDASMPAAVRRRAARDVLEMSIRFRENVDLEERVRAGEERLAE